MKVLYSNAIKRLILILCALVVLLASASSTAFAYAYEYNSAVLDDLTKDESFNVEDYPEVSDDYSLKLIHLAESIDDEIYVYVYHPSGQATFLPATYVRMKIDGVEGVNDYLLTLESRDGVFAKYLVNGVSVGNSQTRSYEVLALYRNWVKGIDEEVSGDNTVSAVPFAVNKRFYITTDEFGLTYSSTFDIKTVEVTDKYVGFINYPKGLNIFGYYYGACSSHFFAFDTDLPIDRIMSARIKYNYSFYSETAYQLVQGYPPIISTSSSGKVPRETFLNELDKGYSVDGIFNPTYEWNRIETVSDFLARPEVSYSDEELQNFEGKKWVFRFFEGAYNQRVEYGAVLTNCDVISDVSLIELEFVLDGVTYNLGVIDNYQTGSRNPVGTVGCWFGWKEIIFLIIILVLIVLVVLFGPRFIIWLFEIIFNVIWWLIKGLWWIISAPFKWIFGQSKDDKDEKGGGR